MGNIFGVGFALDFWGGRFGIKIYLGNLGVERGQSWLIGILTRF